MKAIPVRVTGGSEPPGGRGDLAATRRVLDRVEGAESHAAGVVADHSVCHSHGVSLNKVNDILSRFPFKHLNFDILIPIRWQRWE